jgi:hypothetical protein
MQNAKKTILFFIDEKESRSRFELIDRR